MKYAITNETETLITGVFAVPQSFETIQVGDDVQAGWVRVGDMWQAPQAMLVVTMRSLQLALVDAGLYQTVTALIAGIPDATQQLKTQIYWEKSATVDRAHPVVVGLVDALTANGVTEAQIDAVFAAAQELDAAA